MAQSWITMGQPFRPEDLFASTVLASTPAHAALGSYIQIRNDVGGKCVDVITKSRLLGEWSTSGRWLIADNQGHLVLNSALGNVCLALSGVYHDGGHQYRCPSPATRSPLAVEPATS